MNDLSAVQHELPTTLENLSKFVLIGRDKLQSVRAEISAIDKLGMAKEVREQKLKEAQEIAELVTLSEMKMGEILKDIPKATPNNNTFHEIDTCVELAKPKSEVIKNIGIDQKTSERFQKMASHPEIVHEAIAEAKQNDDIVSRTTILNKIRDAENEKRKSVLKWAEDEHKSFSEKKQSGEVISIKDIKDDRENVSLLDSQTGKKAYSNLMRISEIVFLYKSVERSDMWKIPAYADEENDMQNLINNLVNAQNDLNLIIDDLRNIKEGEKEVEREQHL